MKFKFKAALAASVLALSCAASSAQAQNTVNTAVDWSTGSPRWTTDDGQFQFKLRGRLMADAYSIDADFGGTTRDASSSGFGTRRARLGVDGKFNEVFKFRAEATFAGSAATWEDIYLEYAPNGMSVWIGNNYVNTTLDGFTSSTVHLTNERALVTNTFGRASRHMGVNVRKYSDNWQITGGFYGDSINNNESNNTTEARIGELRGSYAFSAARGNIAHVGASVRYRDRNQSGAFSYSSRPVQTNYGSSFLSTGSIGQKDTTYGIEGLFSKGSFTAVAEYQILEAKTLVEDLTFNGGYIELSYFLTGETRGYSANSGTISGVKPNSPLQEGGYGAWAIVGRYDTLDLSDGTLGKAAATTSAWRTAGGSADAYSIGVLWQPTDFVIFRATYGYTDFKDTQGIDSAAATQITGNGDAQTFTIRTQFSF
mgnify:CR=1 FL=1